MIKSFGKKINILYHNA